VIYLCRDDELAVKPALKRGKRINGLATICKTPCPAACQSLGTSEYATSNLEKAGYLSVSRKANCSNRYEMSLPKAGTATDCDRVPQQTAGATATHCGGVPQHVAPEPLSITSEVTSDIKPLISTQNQYLENEESKWVGERGPAGLESEPTKIVVSEALARQVRHQRVLRG
jgi:hypothetical protein